MKKIRQMLALFASLVLFSAPAVSLAALTSAAKDSAAKSSSIFPWKHPGGAPFAPSRRLGMKHRREAFQCDGIKDPVVLEKLVALTSKPGKKISIKKGDHIGTMVSKGCKAHPNTVYLPLDPDGTVEAEQWILPLDELSQLTITWPYICSNWSVEVTALTPPPSDQSSSMGGNTVGDVGQLPTPDVVSEPNPTSYGDDSDDESGDMFVWFPGSPGFGGGGGISPIYPPPWHPTHTCVPEPEAWVLMTLGLCCIGGVLRKRPRSAQT